MAARKKPESKVNDTTLRHLWLAGLGVAESARRASLTVVNDAADRLDVLKKRVGLIAVETQANVRDGIATAREQGGSRASEFSAEVEARLVPVLAKLGLKPATAPRARKPTRQSTAKRAAAVSRKPVAKRKVGKVGKAHD